MHVGMEGMRTGEKGEETGPRMGQDAPTDRPQHAARRPRGPVHKGALAPAKHVAVCVGCREGGGEVHKA